MRRLPLSPAALGVRQPRHLHLHELLGHPPLARCAHIVRALHDVGHVEGEAGGGDGDDG